MTGAQRQTLEVDGCRLSYLRAGAGEPVLFLHGEDGVWDWAPWMARLAEHYDVIVPDHPAFGFSDWPDWLDNIHDVAYFYLDVLEALKVRGVHVLGHSLGGWIACELAIRDCSALRSLTLVASGGLRLTGVPKLDRFIIPPEAVVSAGFVDPSYAAAELALQRTPEELDRDLRNRFAVARLQWQPRHDLALPKWMHRIKVPTLTVWGDGDRLVPPVYAAEFQRLIPGATGTVIAGCGHFPQTERTEQFLAAVTGFYESLTR